MIAFPVILIAIGLIFLFVHRRIHADIGSMDDNYTGDLLPDEEKESTYKQDRRIKKSFQKGSYYLGALFLFWGVVFLIVVVFFG